MKRDDPNGERLYNPDGWGCGKKGLLVLLVVAVLCLGGWLA